MMRHKRALHDLDQDIQDHIECETRENIERGMSPEEARRQALLKFGNVALVKEDTRAIWRWQRVEQLAQDSWYAVRVLRRRPVYALLSVLTLALGIGGTAAVFGVAHGVLLSPLPYAHERELGVFWMKTDWTHEEYLHIRGRTPGFRQVALYRQRDAMLRAAGGGPARLVPGVSASSELLDVLGAAPLLGRGFREGDDVPGAERVALLSFGLWQELGGNPAIIGTHVMLDGRPRTVIGVMPRGFWFPDPSVRIWTPEPLRADSRSWNSTLIGRVAPNQDIRAMDGATLATGRDARRAFRLRRAAGQDEGPADHAGARRPARAHATGAARNACRHRTDPLDRVRQRCSPGARAGRRAVGRVRGSFGAWCEPAATGAAADRRGADRGGRRGDLGRRPGLGRLHRRHGRAPARCVGLDGARLARVRVGHGHRRHRGVARHPRAHRLAVSRRPAQRVERRADGRNRGTGRAAGKRAGRRAGGARGDDRLGCGAARSQCRQHVRGPTWRAGGWRRGRRRGVRRHARSCEPREDARRARAGAA